MILECVRNNVGKESSTEFFIKTFNEIFLTEEIEDFLQSFSIFSTGLIFSLIYVYKFQFQ